MPPYRRITLAVGIVMFVDASLYLAVLPLLPHYAEQFHLNTFQSSLVLAAYPVSVPFVSIACVYLVPRWGTRRITLGSALLMTVSTAIFAGAPNVEILILARFVQGFASGSVWTASMAWVTDNAPPGKRGRESGIVMGLLSAGSVAGPGIGALAASAGSDVAFGLVAALSAISVVLVFVAPAGREVEAEPDVIGAIRRGARQPATIAAIAMTAIDVCSFGAVDLLVPLHLGNTGTSVTAIAVAFAVGALLGALIGPVAGRIVDRVGAAPVGLAVGVVVVLSPLIMSFQPPDHVQLAMIVIWGPAFAVVGASMFPLSTMGADAAGVSHVNVTALIGIAWAGGFAIYALVIGAIANATSTATAFAVATALCVPALVVLARCVRQVMSAEPTRGARTAESL